MVCLVTGMSMYALIRYDMIFGTFLVIAIILEGFFKNLLLGYAMVYFLV